jgi:TolB-like protein
MRSFALLVVVFVVFSVSVFAADKDVISVLDFNVNNITKSEMQIFTDFIASHIVNTQKYRVIDRMQRDSILKEIEFSLKDCSDESCQLKIGKMLAANLIIVGSLGKVSDLFIINIKLIQVQSGETVRSKSNTYDNMNALIKDSENLTLDLLGMKKAQSTEIAETKDTTWKDVGTADNKKSVQLKSDEQKPNKKQLFFDVATGVVAENGVDGVELDLAVRYTFFDFLSPGIGVLVGYQFSSFLQQPGIKFGVHGKIAFRFSDAFGVAIGFKGLPDYIDYFGGPSVTLYIFNFMISGAFNVMSPGGAFCIDLGYSF